MSVRPAILTLFVGSALWFSSLLPAPCFLCLLSRLVTLVPPLNVGSFIITFEHIISIRKNYELNNHKWSCKEFPGYRGYYDVWLVYICLSWVYCKDLKVSQGSVRSDLCSKLREILLRCDGRRTDGWQKHFWWRLFLLWNGYLRKYINSHALFENLPMFFFHYKNISNVSQL